MTATLFCLLLIGPGLAACGDESKTSTPSPATSSATPAVCGDLDALQASVDKLTQVKIGENGLSTLSTELTSIQSEVQQLSKDAPAQYSTETNAVRSAVSSLKSSIQAASAAPSATSFGAVAADVKAVGSAVQVLSDAVSGTC